MPSARYPADRHYWTVSLYCPDQDGAPDFNGLRSAADRELVFFAFDQLHRDDKDPSSIPCSCTPCDRSSTSSLVGQRVAERRRRSRPLSDAGEANELNSKLRDALEELADQEDRLAQHGPRRRTGGTKNA
jgi:hypothetical protein